MGRGEMRWKGRGATVWMGEMDGMIHAVKATYRDRYGRRSHRKTVEGISGFSLVKTS